MFSKNHPIILFIDRLGFSAFQDTQANIARFNFTPDLVANLDVVNKEKFSSLILTFIQINKIAPSSLAIILSDTVIYEKDLTNPANSVPNPPLDFTSSLEMIDKEKAEIQNFLENIPFEEVLAKVIKTDKVDRIVAVNKDLIQTIADVFVSKGSLIEAIIPSFLYQPNVNFTSGLTRDNVKTILERSEIVRMGNLLTDQQKMNSSQDLEVETKEQEKKPQNARQFIFIGVFIVLLIILVIVYLNSRTSQTSPSNKKTMTSVENVINTPTPVSALPQTAAFPSADLKSIKIKIMQNSSSDEVADGLKVQLSGIGFTDIASEVSTNTVPEKTSVLFSQNISEEVRNNVLMEIKKILPDISILENQESNSSITILIGKS